MYIYCPSCKDRKNICIGEIPQVKVIQGIELENHTLRSKLYKCKECNLYFRYPRHTIIEHDRLYKKASLECLNYNFANRKDWQLSTKWINRINSGGSIIDIGCWDGSFLEKFGEDWKPYGIEINIQAASKARDRGITILAENFSDISQLNSNFNVVTAFDVIEHVENPLSFVENLSKITEDDGLIIISSGNTEAITWKIMGSKYSYCTNPEHISFINSPWCYYVAKRLNLNIEYIKKFSHSEINNVGQFLIGSMTNIIYLISPALIKISRKIKSIYLQKENIYTSSKSPPPWRGSNDHIIIFLRKADNAKTKSSH